MASNLTKRIAFAAVAIPLALAVVWLGGPALAALVAAVAVLGTKELFAFAEHQGIRPALVPGYLAAAAVPLLVWAFLAGAGWGGTILAAWPHAAALWVLAVLVWVLAMQRSGAKPLTAAAVTIFAPIYCGALPAFLIGIRHAGFGPRSWAGAVLVFFPLVVTWICDTAAMFVGKAIGGPKLAPVISPGKTRSGGIGGFLGAIVAALLWNFLVLEPAGVAVTIGQAVIFGAVIGVVAQVGDLVESVFKREIGVKDSGGLIPGHGGVLDRFDSLYFVLPVAAAMLRLFGTG
jgi:phosphatidate cytidylyltransferase